MGKFTTLSCVALLAAGAIGSQAQAEQTVLRYNRWLPPTHDIDNKVFKPWFDEVARVTQGRVKIVFTTSSLGPLPRQYELATSGVADITFGSQSLTPGRFPLAEILELPFLGNSAESVSVAYWRVYKAHFEKAKPYKGVKLLGLSGLAPYGVQTVNKPITSIASFSGMKIRAAGKHLGNVLKQLGAVPVSASVTQLHDLYSKGIIDGGLGNDDQIRSFRLAKYIKHRTVIPGGISNYATFVVVNSRKWAAISKTDQAAIEKISGEALARSLGRIIDNSAALGVKQMQAGGAKTVVAKGAFLANLKSKLAVFEQGWVKKASKTGVDAAAALKMLRSEAAAYKP